MGELQHTTRWGNLSRKCYSPCHRNIEIKTKVSSFTNSTDQTVGIKMTHNQAIFVGDCYL